MRLKTHRDNVKGTLSRAQIFTSMTPIPARAGTIVLVFGWMVRAWRRRLCSN
jgi:hypothetical protein